MKYISFILVIAGLCCLAASMPESSAIKEYFIRLKQSGYNADVLPEGRNGQGSPIDVFCTMYIINIFKVDDHSMDYRAQFYFRQSWNDSRLAYLDQDIDTIVVNDAANIWTPDLFFVQEKTGYVSKIITPNVFIKIHPNGHVLFSVRLDMTFSCSMDFAKYPHDTQKCIFSAESYGRPNDVISIQWNGSESIGYDKNINLLPFEFKGFKESVRHSQFTFGNYSCLEVELTFQRKTGFYFTRMYVPFLFLVALSWLSFWIPAKMISLRLSLLLVIMYLMVNIADGINDFIPPASYTKGSDIWIAFCESMVFAAFLVFIAVHIISRNKEKLEKRMRNNDPEAQRVLDSDVKIMPVSSNTCNSTVSKIANRLKRDVLISSRIDIACRMLFPCLFLIFNFLYWLVYCTGN